MKTTPILLDLMEVDFIIISSRRQFGVGGMKNHKLHIIIAFDDYLYIKPIPILQIKTT